MTDIFDSITSALRDRLVSPLAGSFITSWLVVNYKVIVVLLSDMKPYVKFSYISNHLWTDWFVTGMYCVALPLAASLAYTLIYPWPARWVLQASLWHQRKTKKAKLDGEGRIPLSREDIDKQKQKWNVKFNKQGEDIQRLEAQLEDFQKREEASRAAEQVMAARAHELAQELENLKEEKLSESERVKRLLAEEEVYEKEIKNLNSKIAELTASYESVIKSANDQTKAIMENSKRLPGFNVTGNTYFFKNASGTVPERLVAESDAYGFLKKYAEAVGQNLKITEKTLTRFAGFIEGLDSDQSNILLEQVKSGYVSAGRMTPFLVNALSEIISI